MGMSFVNCPPFLDIRGLDTVVHCFCQRLTKRDELANVFDNVYILTTPAAIPFTSFRQGSSEYCDSSSTTHNPSCQQWVARTSYPTTHVASVIWKSSPPVASNISQMPHLNTFDSYSTAHHSRHAISS